MTGCRGPRQLALCMVLLGLTLAPATAEASPPDWALEEIRRGEGRWIADNSAYKSADEPIDAYGMEWTLGVGGMSLVGRLFPIANGEELDTVWEYRLFWHPGKQALQLLQFGGDGTLGEGLIESTGPDTDEATQRFFGPDGSTWQSGHRTSYGADRRSTHSYSIDADGNWSLLRTYTWIKQP